MPAPDPYPMAEERRLFYVALTRARRQVRIYTSLTEPSRFLVELANNGSLTIKTESGGILTRCPKCAIGMVRRQDGKFGAFDACSTWPRCDFTQSTVDSGAIAPATRVRIEGPMSAGDVCPHCQRGSMVVRSSGKYGSFLACSEYPSCQTTAQMPGPGHRQ
jgi:DNA helicase-4